MSASDMKAGSVASASRQGAADGAAESLARTLENLEARLSRLSGGRREPEHPADVLPEIGVDADGPHLAARLRSVAEQRLSGSSRFALDAGGAGDDAGGRRRRPNAALDRRIGTIAGEVEALKVQGSTLQLVSSIADDIQTLRAEITETVGARSEAGFEEIRSAFEELCERIAESDRSGMVAEQISAVMKRLSTMQEASLDRGALEPLRGDLKRVEALVAQVAKEETVNAGARRWEDFEARLEAHISLDGNAKRDLQAELERLRHTVRSLASQDQVHALEQRWDEFEARHFETLRTETQDRFAKLLRTELKSLGERIDLLAATAVSAEADRSEQAAAAERTGEALTRLTSRLGELEEALVELPGILGIDRLEERLEELADGLALVSRQQQEPDLEHFAILEERLDEISEAIVTNSLREEPVFDAGPIERMEARLAELASRVDRLTSASETAELSHRIVGLSARLEDIADQGQSAADERLATFSSRIEAALDRLERPRADTAMFEERLTALATRLDEVAAAQVDEDVLRSLEMQITRLGEQLSATAGPAGPGDEEVQRRLSALEERLEQNREDVMAAARAAADEAVRQMRADAGNRDGEHVRNLSEDLRSLEALCRETDNRSIQVFEAVHSTLVKIAERLTTIEAEVRSEDGRAAMPVARLPEFEAIVAGAPMEYADHGPEEEQVEKRGLRAAISKHLGRRPERAGTRAETAEPATLNMPLGEPVADRDEPVRARIEDAPSIDPADGILFREANRPLEPGSGAPDIASLIDRVRMQQQRAMNESGETAEAAGKADFIAAARKAAMAAAAEAENLRRESDETNADGENRPANGNGRFGRHRKPILMAVGAVLLAMMAIPLGRVAIQPEAAGTLVETAALPAPAATAPEPEAALVEEAASVVSAENPADEAIVTASVPASTSRQTAAADRPSIAELAAARAGSMSGNEGEAVPAVAAAPVRDAPAVETAAVAAEPETPMATPANAAVLAAAVERLPDSARAELPAMPSGIGPTALAAAVDAGDAMAIFEVGLRLMEGRSGASDVAAAFTWFAHAGALGYAPAQYSLGTLYEKGNGIGRDTQAARDWYMLAADQGNVRAMHNLAVLYATGIDGRSEPETAARWFTAAAEHGMRDSQYNLGILHARGAGVNQDFGQSYKWFSIVGSTGDRDAAEKRDEVAKTLSEQQIAALDAEVAAFEPRVRVEAANAVDVPASWSEAGEQTASVDMNRAVRNVQAILVKLGFDPGTPDGIAGSRTAEAVRAFQKQNGMEETGRIDETLIRELLRQNV